MQDQEEERGLSIVVLAPGEGTRVPANLQNDDQVTLKVTGKESNGLLTVLEYDAVPHSEGTPPHVHQGHEEGFYVVSGRLSMLVGDDRIVVEPGGWGFVPRGVLHAFWNEEGEPCRFVATFTPPGFERIFFDAQVAAAEGLTHEQFRQLAIRHGVTDVPWEQVSSEARPRHLAG